MPVKIFCCYAHEDEPLLKKLKAHLRPLQRQGLVKVWYDRDISAGTDWEQQIKEQLNTAQIILLLVSPDFMDSDYCYGIEMKRAIERDEQGEARVIPIILRPVDIVGTPFRKLQALPTDAKAVMSSSWQYQDEAFVNVTEGIRKVIEEITTKSSPFSRALPIQPTKPEMTEIPANVLKQQPVKPEPLVTPEDFSWLCTLILRGDKYSVYSVAFSPDGQTLASDGGKGTIKLWNPKTGDLLRTLRGDQDFVYSVAFSPDGQTLASGGGKGRIQLWNPKTGDLLCTLISYQDSVNSVAFSPDGQTLASGSSEQASIYLFGGDVDIMKLTIKLWNPKTGDLLRTLREDARAVTSVAFSPDGQTLVSASSSFSLRTYLFGGSDKIKLWNPKTGDHLLTMPVNKNAVTSVAFSPDGQTLASGGSTILRTSFFPVTGGTIKLWNPKTGDLLRTLRGDQDFVYSVAFSPDGQTLASGGGEGTIKLWNPKTGDLLRTLRGHDREVWSVAFSPYGQTLASCSDDETIKLWKKK